MHSFFRNPVLAAALSSNIADGRSTKMQEYPTGHLQSLPSATRAAPEVLEDRASNTTSKTSLECDLRAFIDDSCHEQVRYSPLRFPCHTASTWLSARALHTKSTSFLNFSGLWASRISFVAAENRLPSESVSAATNSGRAVTEFTDPSQLDVHTPGRESPSFSVRTTPSQSFASPVWFPLFFGSLMDGGRCFHPGFYFHPSFPGYNDSYSKSLHVPAAGTFSAPPATGRHHSSESVADDLTVGSRSAASASKGAVKAEAPEARVFRTAAPDKSSTEAIEAAGEASEAFAILRRGLGRSRKPTLTLDVTPLSSMPYLLETRATVLNGDKVKAAQCSCLDAALGHPCDEDAAAQRLVLASSERSAAVRTSTKVEAAAAEGAENSSTMIVPCNGIGSNAAGDTAIAWEAKSSAAVAEYRGVGENWFATAGLHVTAAKAEEGQTLATVVAFRKRATGEDDSISSFLRGGRGGSGGREWTDTEGGSDGQEEVIFTGSSDALFFPAFPVHRCRGVSLWDVETNERVCLGKFEETGGLLLLTPETLSKLAVSFRTPFFDGIVLRAFVTPPGGTAFSTGYSHAHQHHRADRHRHPAASSHHSPPAARHRPTPSSPSAYGASNGRSLSTSTSPTGAALPATGNESTAVAEKRSVSASQRDTISGSSQNVNASSEVNGRRVTAISSKGDLMRASDGEPVRDGRKSVSHKQQRVDKEKAEVSLRQGTVASAAEDEKEVLGVPRPLRTGEAHRKDKTSAPNGAKVQEDLRKETSVDVGGSSRNLGSSSKRDKEVDADVSNAYGEKQQQSQLASPADSYRDNYRVTGQHRVTGGRASSLTATAASAGGVRAAATGEGDMLSRSDTGRRGSRHGGLQAHASDPSEAKTAEGTERKIRGRTAGIGVEEMADRGGRGRRESQSLPNPHGSPRVTPATSRPKPAAEGVRALEGVLIDPEELLQAMEARRQQHLHASVDGQWMQFERPRHNIEYKLCIGESYWMAMKIPLEACNPFLLNRNDVVVDLVEPQQQQPAREAAAGAAASQSRRSRSSALESRAAAAARHGQQQQPDRPRGGRESAATAARSRPGAARAGSRSETIADQDSSSSRSTNFPSALDGGSENGVVDRPRSFTSWIGNRLYDRMYWIAASAPTGLTNAANRLANSLPTTPEEAEELGKKWSEQSLRAARAVSASTKLLMRSFKHAAAELWLFITEGKSGTSSTGGGMS